MSYDKLTIFTDGGSRNNPGPAGIGAVILDGQGNVVAEISEYIGIATNNQAEYRAVVIAMEKAKELDAKDLDFFLDSQLVVKQLNREYRVKDQDLAPYFLKIHNLSMSFKKITYTHIPREQNSEADRLVNLALDREMKK